MSLDQTIYIGPYVIAQGELLFDGVSFYEWLEDGQRLCECDDLVKDAHVYIPNIGDWGIRISAHACGVLKAIEGVLRRPEEYSQESPTGALVDALVTYSRDFAASAEVLTFKSGLGRNPFALLEDELVGRLDKVVKDSDAAPTGLRGKTTIYSQVLRVGRSREGGPLNARLTVRGRNYDLKVANPAAAAPFFKAAESQRVVRVFIDAHWLRTDDGMRLNSRRSVALHIDEKWSQMSGDAFLAAVDAAAPGFAGTLDAVLEELKLCSWSTPNPRPLRPPHAVAP